MPSDNTNFQMKGFHLRDCCIFSCSFITQPGSQDNVQQRLHSDTVTLTQVVERQYISKSKSVKFT